MEEMLKLVQMTQYARRKPHQLSGGQRQRVALARSLAKRPKLLLLDEPMGALDKKLRSQMQLELVEIIERVGVTCVMVTHDQEEAMTMAERIAIMHLGCIEQIGSPMDIYETPASRLVCEFIGNVNLFDGLLVEDEQDHATIACADLEQPIYVGHGISSRAENKKVTYALRPEKLLMSLQKPVEIEHPDFNWTKGEVYDIAYLGGHSVYHIQLPSGKIVQAFIANAERHGKRPTWDDQVFSTGKMTAAWCCNHDGIETTEGTGGAAAGDRHPVLLAVPVLPAALHHSGEDQLCRSGRGDPALHRRGELGRRSAHHLAAHGQLPAAAGR